MRHNFTLSHGCILGVMLAGIATPAWATLDPYDDTSSTGVKKVAVRDFTKSTPVIKVKSKDGQKYDTIDAPAALYFNAHYDMQCSHNLIVKSGSIFVQGRWTSSNFWNGPTIYPKQSTNAGSNGVVGDMVVGGFLTSKVMDRAKAVCNAKAKAGGAHSNGKVFSVTSSFKYNADYRLYLDLGCGYPGNKYSGAWKGKSFKNAPVTYQCVGYKPPPTRVPPKPPPQRVVPFLTTKLVVDTNPKSYTGKCPVNIKFGAAITANRDGVVKYRWQTSTNGLGPVHSMTFTKAGTKYTPQPTMQIKEKGAVKSPSGSFKAPSKGGQVGGLTNAPAGTQSHFVKLLILSPAHKVKSAEKHFNVKCKKSTGPGLKTPTGTGGGIGGVKTRPGGGGGGNKADITFTVNTLGKNRFHVGNKSKTWGQTLSLNASDANKVYGNGKCRFPYKFSIRNKGGVATAKVFKVVLKQGNKQLDSKNGIKLNAGQSKWVQGKFTVKNGNYQLKAILDSNNRVNESNENNNQKTIKIKVSGCG